MSWREFQLRRRAYDKAEKEDWIKVREMAFASLIGPHVDPKKLPKSKEQFIPLEPKKKVSNSALERLRQLQLEYQRNKNG